ncbi:hypothetical protein ABW19_dt0206802 [Dactylella cylindrospora]|nr:hypothetical protein ABW19_dt0206802 [Dactylella cylindrospora]
MASTSTETTSLLSDQTEQHSWQSSHSSQPRLSIVTNGKSSPSIPQLSPIKSPTNSNGDDLEPGGLPDTPNVSLAAILPSLMIGVFLAAMDNLVVASAYGRIGSDLHQLSKTSWLASAYLITTTSFQPLYGKLSDIFGRKACLIFAYVVFAIGSGWCGLARSMDELIIARAFAGIGGGGMTTLVSILMSDIVPLHKRGTWQGIINIVYATGASTGAPLGGFLADGIGWRWAFLIQVPFTLLAALLVGAFLHMPHHHPDGHHDTTWKKFKRVDFGGAVTLVLAVLTLLIALDRGGNVSWQDKTVLITGPISIALFIMFGIIEGRLASDPFAPPRIVFDKGLLACFLCNLFAFAAFFAVLFYIPLYFQAVADLTASQSGLRMLPAIAGSVSGSLAGGIIMQKTGKYFILTVVAYSTMVVGSIMVLLATGVIDRVYPVIGVGLCVMGFGSGIGVTTTLIGLIARSGARDQAVSTAVSYLFRSLGSVVGVSVASTLLQGALRADLKKSLKGMASKEEIKEIIKKATGSLEFLRELRPEVKAVVIAAYESAVRYPFLMAVSIGLLSVVSSLFIIEQPLKKGATGSSSPSDSEEVDGNGVVNREQEP